ncbi:MFS transporter [Actinoplanes sp. NPDC051411]|uniref:MFS transporter n=1 Tax=Actinoplanes sp. NPDC051411 TaxID=3155522 RepID=UPI0034396375
MPSLWRDHNFVALRAGQTVSEMGSAITGLALPLLAIGTLGAGTGQVGVLQACATGAYLLASIPAGVLVDRSRKRRLMVAADVGRFLLLATVPLASGLAQLYLVAFLTGVLGVVFGLAYHAYYPIFVTPAALPDANAKISTTEAVARVSGPGVAALLIGVFSAATVVLFDALSFLVSAASLLLPKVPGDVARPARRRVALRHEVRDGFRLVAADSVLARTAIGTIGSMLCLGMVNAVLVYFLVRDLGVSATGVGVLLGIGEAGGLAAALLARPVMRRAGSIRVMWLAVLASPAGFLAAVTTRGSAPVLVGLFLVLSSARFVLFDIAQYSYRQLVCPLGQLGKANATIRLGVGTASALGALAGGGLGTLIGARATLAVATTLLCLAALPVLTSRAMSSSDSGRRVRENAPPEASGGPF